MRGITLFGWLLTVHKNLKSRRWYLFDGKFFELCLGVEGFG
jgi:hypothetical protein